MARHLREHREGFGWGESILTPREEADDNTGIGFSIVRLRAAEIYRVDVPVEKALLHMDGEARFMFEGREYRNKRSSLFDEGPFALHGCCDSIIEVEALSDCEVALFTVDNDELFASSAYLPEEVEDERRGAGLVDDASLRLVRTIFDGSNSPPESLLVLGEVVTLPGRWSSYPPHHHRQPEIYHYRFTDSRGYGHGELGEEVIKVRHNDTVKILDGLDHAQCAVPGYGMYYLWVIRHLADERYSVPTFTPEHRWTMEPTATFWQLKDSCRQSLQESK